MTTDKQKPYNAPILSQEQHIPDPAITTYKPPKTSLFLEPKDIQGGATNVAESDGGDGLLS